MGFAGPLPADSLWMNLRHLLGVVLLALSLVCCTSDDAAPALCTTELDGFSHRSATVNGVRVHYVIGGHGPTVVLLHGFPETWWTWRQVMPLLAAEHTVIAPDLRGVGDSSTGPAYDADSLADDIHALMQELGIPRAVMVGHDTGGWTAYAYARRYRDEVSHLVLSGTVIPGFGFDPLLDFRWPGPGLAHLPFFMQPQIPELLISGREHEYFDRFIGSETVQRSGAVDCYADSYARPGRLTAALGQYRALYLDADHNRQGAGGPLAMPTLAVSGVGGDTALSANSLRLTAGNVTETEIPGAGHYVQEERPAELARALVGFIG